MPRSPSFLYKYFFVVYMIYCFYVGALLTVMPWISWIWENNYLLYHLPAARPYLLNPFLRGAVSGLGILNILIGIEEIVRYRRWKHTPPAE